MPTTCRRENDRQEEEREYIHVIREGENRPIISGGVKFSLCRVAVRMKGSDGFMEDAGNKRKEKKTFPVLVEGNLLQRAASGRETRPEALSASSGSGVNSAAASFGKNTG